MKTDKFLEETKIYLKKLISKHAKISADDIDVEEELEVYGIDSLMIINLNKEIEADFGDVSRTLFFEYKNIEELANYFVQNYPEKLEELFLTQSKTVQQNVKEAVSTNTKKWKQLQNLKTHAMFSRPEQESHVPLKEEIAIIGISGKYPKADNLDVFWKNLKEGTDCITEIPKERWDAESMYDPDKAKRDKIYTKWGGFLDDVDKFDAEFFNITPREANTIDPQERIFLENALRVFEDAGYPKSKIANRNVGVFAGVMFGQYQIFGKEIGEKDLVPTSSYASVANRVSYYFDLTGPSMSVDTMCSSSLSAIHLAFDSLIKGECEMALAGGVSVSIHPLKYRILSQQRFASSDGKCHTFGEGGDGYVSGEGVGAVLMKPLSKAIEDKDHIYAVIKGTAMNHGGKTNGYSVPNPNAQEKVVLEVLKKTEVNPETISYLEAHGTGTSLGDPIEITALTKAYQNYTKKKSYCPIGSVKSNIGHTESAAGIAAVTKVVLMMQHKKLVPSLHSEQLNSNIKFEETPFYVQHEYEDWKAPVVMENQEEKEYPRRAGISAFGAGGTNVHIVLEEYSKNETSKNVSACPNIFMLSAKNEERLRAYAAIVLWYMKTEGKTKEISDILYSFQRCKEALEERLAFIACNHEEVEEGLTRFLEQEAMGLHHENVLLCKNRVQQYNRTMMDESVNQKDWEKIAQLWCEGMKLKPDCLWESRPNVITLPAYPFLRERHWVNVRSGAGAVTASVHPLLDQNTSTIYKECFYKKFTNDKVVNEHVVFGKKLVPGSAQVEMIRAAACEALGREVSRIENICWLNPIYVETEQEVSVTFLPQESDLKVLVTDLKGETEFSRGSIPYADIKAEQIELSQQVKSVKESTLQIMQKDEINALFEEAGFSYGTSYQLIHTMWCGDWEAVSELKIQDTIQDEKYVLHPCIVDAALRTALGINGQLRHQMQLRVPFSCDEIVCYEPLETDCLVYARIQDGSRYSLRDSMLCDVYILNQEGKCLAKFIGFNGRVLPKSQVRQDIHYYQPEECEIREANTIEHFGDCLVISEHPVIFSFLTSEVTYVQQINQSKEEYRYLFEQYDKKNLTDLLIVLPDGRVEKSYDEAYMNQKKQRGLFSLWHLFQAICEVMPETDLRITILNQKDALQYNVNDAIEGFAGSMQNINHHIQFRIIENRTKKDWTQLETQLEKVFVRKETTNRSQYLITEDGIREKGIMFVDWKESEEHNFRQGGVYLVTGALGGIGSILLQYLAKTYQATLILVGRSALTDQKQEKLNELEALGSKVHYYAADVTDCNKMNDVICEAKKNYGAIHGVFHLAGTIQEVSALEAKESDYEQMLRPKMDGSIVLDEVTKEEGLDFFVVFSSVSTVIGDYGIGAYSAANAFLNEFANVRNELVLRGMRKGNTISVNWPLWESEGMELPQSVKVIYKNYAGLDSMNAEQGMHALEYAIKYGNPVIYCVTGDCKKINRIFLNETKKEAGVLTRGEEREQTKSQEISKQDYVMEVSDYLKHLLADAIDMPAEKIRTSTEFDILGIDSIMIMEINEKIAKEFPKIPKTLFFEYKTIDALTQYFIATYPDELRKKFGEPTQRKQVEKEETIQITNRFAQRNVETTNDERQETTERHEDIAIIGVSGIYPESGDLDELWSNLVQKKDCIRVIPKERWDYTKYYDIQKGKKGKVYCKWGGFIPEVDQFDASFFNMSIREAEMMDPQERMFIETVWHAVEDAGYNKKELANKKVGVFAAAMYSHYQLFGLEEALKGNAYVASSFFSSIANRVSYLCDFHGPSLTLDTACSSSLETVRLACQNILDGCCDMAVAGGVNLTLHPSKYLFLCQSTFLSSDGKCKSFGAGGDGYVPGEGVGALILKDCKQAIKDGDHIYGVIKGIATNHGGHTNGYSVPSPMAQSQVIQAALESNQIPAWTINCIEAHGTGTALGDPIEIEGIKKAYDKTGEVPCSIGSIKSNIGHLEAAAGVASITKVLLEMKHKKLVPSIHSEQMNPNIDLKDTRFYVQHEVKDWDSVEVVSEDGKKRQVRRAGVSAFGAGGTNVHVVLEDYQQESSRHEIEEPEKQLFVLSAREKSALLNQAEQLYTYLSKKEEEYRSHFRDIAYTLTVGRNVWEERVAFCAASYEELLTKLDLVRKNSMRDEISYGSADTSEPLLRLEDEEDKKYAMSLIANCNLENIAKFWVSGVDFELKQLYPMGGRRVSLPGYPFSHKKCWVSVPENTQMVKRQAIAPFLDENMSSLDSVKFHKSFEENSPIMEQHAVNQIKTLPGAAYIEMLYEAGNIACKKELLTLKNIHFLRTYTEASDRGLNVEIVRDTENNSKAKIYSDQGELYFTGELSENSMLPETRQAWMPQEILKRCKQSLSGEQLNEKLVSAGFYYGENYQKIVRVDASTKEAIVTLQPQEQDKRFWISPYLLDAVFRSVIGIGLCGEKEIRRPMIPYMIDQLQVFDLQSCISMAHIEKKLETADGKMARFTIRCYSEQGDLLLLIENFTVREIVIGPKGEEKLNQFYVPMWKRSKLPVTEQAKEGVCLILSNQKEFLHRQNMTISDMMKVITVSSYASIDYELLRHKVRSDCGNLYVIDTLRLGETKANEEGLDAGIQALEERVYFFRWVVKNLPQIPVNHIILTRLEEDVIQPNDMLFAGMGCSIPSIRPNYRMKLIAFDQESSDDSFLWKKLAGEMEFLSEDKRIIKYVNGLRYESVYERMNTAEGETKYQGLRNGGTYLVTGGFGGLGRITAKYLAAKYHANLMLIGRSPLTEEKRGFLEELKSMGSRVVYRTADVCERAAVEEVFQEMKKTFGAIHGIFHCAGVAFKYLVTDVTQQQFRQMLAAKVIGTQILDELTKDERLDFLIHYSSISSFMGDYGAVAYASASTFMDGYSIWRNKLVQKGQRSGHSLAINWPFWNEGGMELDPIARKQYIEYLQLQVIDKEDGMCVLEKLTCTDYPQVAYLKGAKENTDVVIRAVELTDESEEARTQEAVQMTTCTDEPVHEKLIEYLKGMLAKITKNDINNISTKSNFERYGVDSIMVIEMNELLEKSFGKLPNTLLFECHSIDELATYLEEKANEEVRKKFAGPEQRVKPESVTVKQEVRTPVWEEKKEWMLPLNSVQKTQNQSVTVAIEEEDDIAVIGIQGKYPLADNLDEFWNNIKAGRNCITEIPEERWDWRDYYNAKHGTPGKTYSKYGGFLQHVDQFDPMFFHITPYEAEVMDPQERLFLQTAWGAFEDAGYTDEKLTKIHHKVGVFVGVMNCNYEWLGAAATAKGIDTSAHSAYWSIANRVSFVMNLNGPSIAIDSACSSSLTAIHLACESIKREECAMAVAGGVNLILHPMHYVRYSMMNMIASDDKCKSFGNGADGFVDGEGVGAIILKRRKDAERDGDHIYGIIKGSYMNACGKTNGYTVPSPIAQAEAIEKACEKAKIRVNDISYIEAHGTGTSLGDPIEIAGLERAFGKETGTRYPVSIGSVKANIGHVEAAAGVASLTKVLLQMKHKELVPSINSDELNPNIDLCETPFYIQHECSEWKRREEIQDGQRIVKPRIAGINSFGAGGANVHMVVEEYIASEETVIAKNLKEDQIIVLSANTKLALKRQAKQLIEFLQAEEKELDLMQKRTELIQEVSRIVADLLDVPEEELDTQCQLSELGCDRILINQVQKDLEKKYELENCSLFNGHGSSIQELADDIIENITKRPSCEICHTSQKETLAFCDIAFTLQTGRNHMKERLAFVAPTKNRTVTILQQFINGIEDGSYQTGTITSQMEYVGSVDERWMEEMVETNNYREIINRWLTGWNVEFAALHQKQKAKIVSMPTYAFDEQHYWIPKVGKTVISNSKTKYADDSAIEKVLELLKDKSLNVEDADKLIEVMLND